MAWVKQIRIRGFNGQDARDRALERSRVATTNPRVTTLVDGSVVGIGDLILRVIDGREFADAMLYGAYGTAAWSSDARANKVLE